MQKRLFVILLIVALIFCLGNCKKDKTTNNQPIKLEEIDLTKPFPIIYRPEPVFIAITSVYPDLKWENYLEKNNSKTEIKDDMLKSMNIGSQLVDALIAVKVEDWNTAKKIGSSMKKLSDDLHVSNQDIENLALQLEDSIKNKDSKNAKLVLDGIQSHLESQLEKMVDKNLPVYAQFGLWINSFDKLSKILIDNYKKEATEILKQNTEINFFLNSFSNLEKKDSPIVIKSIVNLKEIEMIINNKEISLDDIKKINKLTSEIKTLL
ncbi:MAG TPA: hypothetical protein PLE45_07060 [Spirochaetota bacterium]|nr:hypothetical protein [Spirochaetota bacterium]HOL56682.1 hypothetical protein [Spirochaetota bacterium]HPP04571.1 hypothetical protein [Spirochaetota bacterium]